VAVDGHIACIGGDFEFKKAVLVVGNGNVSVGKPYESVDFGCGCGVSDADGFEASVLYFIGFGSEAELEVLMIAEQW
jgi:hypothetical protein